jgi:acyl-CoA synthetase (NDP forming)
MLTNFFNPKSIAVIGASEKKNKLGYALLIRLRPFKKSD